MDVQILVNGSDVEGRSLLDEGQGLPDPIECGVSPDHTNLNALLNLTWKHNNNTDIVTYSNGTKPSIYQVYERNRQRLYIRSSKTVDYGRYSCHYTWINGSAASKFFTLNVSGIVYL